MDWLMQNGLTILEIIGAVLGVASLITGLTKSEKDDAVVLKLIHWLSFVQPRNGKGYLSAPGRSPKVD